MIVRERGRR